MAKLIFKIISEEKFKSGIYAIRSLIDERVYVGSTINFYRRWKEYNFKLRNGHSHNVHLLNFVQKYGIENLEFSVLEFCDVNELEARETFWMNHLQSVDRGFNIRKDAVSNRGLKHSEETKAKMRLRNHRTNLGKKLPLEQRRNISAGLKTFWSDKEEAFRKQHGARSAENRIISVEAREKSSKALKLFYSKNKHPVSKAVLQIDLLTGQIINEFPSMTSAANHLQVDSCGITKTIKGEQKSCAGFYWKLKYE